MKIEAFLNVTKATQIKKYSHTVDVIAGRIIFAIAVDRTVLAVLQERARSIARRATPSRLAKALSGPGVTPSQM